MLELTLTGSIPAKKNSRSTNKSTGRSFSSKRFVQWQDDALSTIRMQTRERFLGLVSIELLVYYGDDRRADNDNCLTSVLDMLVEALVIPEDRWQHVVKETVEGRFREKKPGAFIRITELPTDYHGEEYAAYLIKHPKKRS